MLHSSIAKFCVPWNQISLHLCRRIVRMRKSSYLWNMYVLEMDSSPSSNSLRRWMWMGRMPTLSSSSSGKRCLSPATTRALCFPTPSWSSGVPSAGTTLPGTLRSSSSGPTASPSSATAGNSWRAASRATSRSCWGRQTDALHANPSRSIHGAPASLHSHHFFLNLCSRVHDGLSSVLSRCDEILWKHVYVRGFLMKCKRLNHISCIVCKLSTVAVKCNKISNFWGAAGFLI